MTMLCFREVDPVAVNWANELAHKRGSDTDTVGVGCIDDTDRSVG